MTDSGLISKRLRSARSSFLGRRIFSNSTPSMARPGRDGTGSSKVSITLVDWPCLPQGGVIDSRQILGSGAALMKTALLVRTDRSALATHSVTPPGFASSDTVYSSLASVSDLYSIE